MAVTALEQIIVDIKTQVSKVSELVNLKNDLGKLKRVGVDVSQEMGFVNERLGQVSTAGSKATRVFGQFKFELLGVLFFGMAVSRFLNGLLKPAFQVTGVFQILRDTMTLFFLPVAEDVSGVIIVLSDLMDSLPEPVREFIGVLVLLVSGIATAITGFAILGLGLTSIESAFGISQLALARFLGKTALLAIALTLIIFLFKDWNKLTERSKVLIGLLSGAAGLGLLAAGLAPVIAAVFILIGAVTLLITGFENMRDLFKVGFFDPFINRLNELAAKINRFIFGINNIFGLKLGSLGPIALGGPTFTPNIIPPADFSPVGGGATNTNTLTSDLTLNISGLSNQDMVSQIADAVMSEINEKAEIFLNDLERRSNTI